MSGVRSGSLTSDPGSDPRHRRRPSTAAARGLQRIVPSGRRILVQTRGTDAGRLSSRGVAELPPRARRPSKPNYARGPRPSVRTRVGRHREAEDAPPGGHPGGSGARPRMLRLRAWGAAGSMGFTPAPQPAAPPQPALLPGGCASSPHDCGGERGPGLGPGSGVYKPGGAGAAVGALLRVGP